MLPPPTARSHRDTSIDLISMSQLGTDIRGQNAVKQEPAVTDGRVRTRMKFDLDTIPRIAGRTLLISVSVSIAIGLHRAWPREHVRPSLPDTERRSNFTFWTQALFRNLIILSTASPWLFVSPHFQPHPLNP